MKTESMYPQEEGDHFLNQGAVIDALRAGKSIEQTAEETGVPAYLIRHWLDCDMNFRFMHIRLRSQEKYGSTKIKTAPRRREDIEQDIESLTIDRQAAQQCVATDVFIAGGNMRDAAKAAGVTVETIEEWLTRDGAFIAGLLYELEGLTHKRVIVPTKDKDNSVIE